MLSRLLGAVVGLAVAMATAGFSPDARAATVTYELIGSVDYFQTPGTTDIMGIMIGDPVKVSVTIDMDAPLSSLILPYNVLPYNVAYYSDSVANFDISIGTYDFTLFGWGASSLGQVQIIDDYAGPPTAPYDHLQIAGLVGDGGVVTGPAYLNWSGDTLMFPDLSLANASGLGLQNLSLSYLYFYDAGQAAYFDWQTINIVPLPAALPLFLSGLAGLGVVGWRSRRRKNGAEQAVN